MFEDRSEAGRQLAKRLMGYKNENPAVVALPRGGVPVGYEVAQRLGVPLDILIVRKLGFPGQPDLAIGAIADGDKWEIVMNKEIMDGADLPPMYLEREISRKLDEIKKMTEAFRGHRPSVNLTDRTVILVDDGIATGATMRVVINRLRRENPKKIIVATPVASREAVDLLKREADGVICLDIPELFVAVGGFYNDFRPISTDEVIECLDLARKKEVGRP